MATTPSSKPIPAGTPLSFALVTGTNPEGSPQLASALSEEEKEALEEPVTLASSMLYGVYYEPESETLVAIFNNSAEQSYSCTLAQYRALISEPSPGKFMWENFL